MKIALVCRGRTYSTAIGKSIALKQNLEFTGNYLRLHHQLLLWYNHRPEYNANNAYAKFTRTIQEETRNIFLKDNFLVKLFPSMLHFPPSLMVENATFDDVKNKFIFDTSVLNLNQYDRYYFLDRNFIYSTLSWIYSCKISYFHATKKHTKNYPKINIDKIDLARTKFYIIEYFMQQKLRNYLDIKNIPYAYINENSYHEYIDAEKLDTVKTPINYENFIENIDELYTFINYWYPICEYETKNWSFY